MHTPPLDGWKANPTTRDGFDHALYHKTDPSSATLENEDLNTLLTTYERVQIMKSSGRLRVLVKERE